MEFLDFLRFPVYLPTAYPPDDGGGPAYEGGGPTYEGAAKVANYAKYS